MEKAEERVERRRQPPPWPPGVPSRLSTGGGLAGQRWWWSLTGSELQDQAGAIAVAGCGSTVPGRPGEVSFSWD